MSSTTNPALIAIMFFFASSLSAQAQSHKGISFQGIIKLPSGELPTKSGLTVNSIILSPNNCILREEQFVGVSIANGYINIPIGTGTVTGDDPGLSLKQVMDNSSTITQGPTKTSGLVCLDSNGNIDSGVTSFNPSSGDGRRKFRLNVTIDSIPIVADFNMRSMAYAINAESADDAKKLNGKADTSFIQTSTNITQIAAESWFSSSALNSLISGTYNAPTATSATSASTLSATLPINKGGTNLTAAGTANQILGVNAGANGLEYKTLTAGSNVTLTHGANSITINATGGGGGGAETDPSVQAFAKNAVSTGLTVNGSNQLTVSYGTTAGTAAEGNDSRIAGAFQSATTLGGDLSGTLPNPSVARLNGVSVSTAVGGDNGKFLKYSSASSGSWSAQFMTLSDLKNSLGTQSAFSFAGCTQAQTLTWSSVTDQMTCQAINGVPAANITGLGSLAAKSSADLATADVTGVLPIANGGTGATTVAQNLIFAGPTSGTGAPSFRSLTAADLPASASYWSSATGGINYAGGNVGIGTANPGAKLDVAGDLKITGGSPGAGKVLTSDANGLASWQAPTLSNITDSVHTAAPNNTRPAVRLLATNASANVDLILSPKGNGGISAQLADSAASGGNKRGTYAVDLQMSRATADQVVQGGFSVIAGGAKNKITSTYSAIGGGSENQAAGTVSVISGGTLNQTTGIATTVGGGEGNQATGFMYSTVSGGSYNQASGNNSTIAGGEGNQASGDYSAIVGGMSLIANSYGMVAVGTYNVPTTGTSSSWVSTEPIFAIGNGQSPGSESNAMTVLKNGNVGIGATAPTNKLTVDGDIGATSFLYTSDARFKKNIEHLENPLEKVLLLKGVQFLWKTSNEKDIGFIAQEVESVEPTLVVTKNQGETDEYKAVKYGNITALLVESIKAFYREYLSSKEEIEKMKQDLQIQKEENNKLLKRIEALELQSERRRAL